jgi:hypothetical protein
MPQPSMPRQSQIPQRPPGIADFARVVKAELYGQLRNVIERVQVQEPTEG